MTGILNNIGLLGDAPWILGALMIGVPSLHNNNKKHEYSVARQHVADIKLFMQSNFHKYITMSDIASYMNINTGYMYNLFVKYEGVSQKQFLNKLRLNKAIELLENSNLSIFEFGNSVGYSDGFQFSKFFASQMNISPLNYRKQIQY